MTLKLNNFDLPDLDAWRTKIKDETKSKKTALYFNEIEGLSFDANDKSQNQNFNTFRTSKINDWQIAANVLVKDEKKANKLALQCLGQGVNLLYLDLQEKSINWALLLKDIHLNFIRIVVNLKSTEQLLSLNQFVDDSDKKTFSEINPGYFVLKITFTSTKDIDWKSICGPSGLWTEIKNQMGTQHLVSDRCLQSTSAANPGYFYKTFLVNRTGRSNPYDFEIFCTSDTCDLNKKWFAGSPMGGVNGNRIDTASRTNICRDVELSDGNYLVEIQKCFMKPLPIYTDF